MLEPNLPTARAVYLRQPWLCNAGANRGSHAVRIGGERLRQAVTRVESETTVRPVVSIGRDSHKMLTGLLAPYCTEAGNYLALVAG